MWAGDPGSAMYFQQSIVAGGWPAHAASPGRPTLPSQPRIGPPPAPTSCPCLAPFFFRGQQSHMNSSMDAKAPTVISVSDSYMVGGGGISSGGGGRAP